MIRELSVENIAIIDRATLPLGDGLTALTGETGAGKSLLIDAIGLALGGRADSDLVRSGTPKGSVSFVADLAPASPALVRCRELGIECPTGELSIRRDVSADGRSSVRINGKAFPVGTLKDVGQYLVDLHSQHDHQSLLIQERQIEFLDTWIGEPCITARDAYSAQFTLLEGLKRKLLNLRTHQRERIQRIDMLRFQVDEIESAGVIIGESEELKNRLSRLQHAQRLAQASAQVLARLADDEGSAIESLSQANRELDSLVSLDGDLQEVLRPLQAALASLDDGVRELRHYAETLDLDPQAVETTAARIDTLQQLFRKYGETESQVLEFLAQARLDLADLEDASISEEDLVIKIQAEDEALQVLGERLTAIRTSGAERFGAEVVSHIRDLAMDSAEFEVILQPQTPQPNGQDRVDFHFSANQGEPLRLLNRVASGGEISRVMLAIKVASAGRAGVPTLIFDEVDTGLSGRAAAVTAKKLQQLAAHYQVVVISHLPQIAGKADVHFRIEKSERNQRVTTSLHELRGEERVAEIARMLAGEHVGDSALANARELIAG